jgi:hypothetical protein
MVRISSIEYTQNIPNSLKESLEELRRRLLASIDYEPWERRESFVTL